MDIKKDRKGKNLTEAEEIRRGGKDTQNSYTKKSLIDADNQYDVVTHLEPDILECIVKWALGALVRTKLVEVIEFQLNYFRL